MTERKKVRGKLLPRKFSKHKPKRYPRYSSLTTQVFVEPPKKYSFEVEKRRKAGRKAEKILGHAIAYLLNLDENHDDKDWLPEILLLVDVKSTVIIKEVRATMTLDEEKILEVYKRISNE